MKRKKNSQNKSFFGLMFLLISILIIGFIFGTEVMKALMLYIALTAVYIFGIGLAIILIYTIIEKREKRKRKLK